MFTEKEIMDMSSEEFKKNWINNEIQDSALKLLGGRVMTAEDKQHVETTE